MIKKKEAQGQHSTCLKRSCCLRTWRIIVDVCRGRDEGGAGRLASLDQCAAESGQWDERENLDPELGRPVSDNGKRTLLSAQS